MEYCSFEGIIPEGHYGAGKVLIWDQGRYETFMDIEAGLKKGNLTFCLYGKRLNGEFALVRIKKIHTARDILYGTPVIDIKKKISR